MEGDIRIPRTVALQLHAILSEQIASPPGPRARPAGPDGAGPPAGISLIPGGFAYAGIPHDLVGRPRDMLDALLQARHHRCTAAELRDALAVDDAVVTYPDQVVRDTATALRAALRKALAAARVSCPNPLPSHGRGKDLTYQLTVP